MEMRRAFKCESCLNVTRRIRVTEDTPIPDTAAATEVGARDNVAPKEDINQSFEEAQLEIQDNTTPKLERMIDTSLFTDIVNDIITAKMKILESQLVKEIKAAVLSISEQEITRLKTELKEANEKCNRFQAEMKAL